MNTLSPDQKKLIAEIEEAFKDDPSRPEEATTLLEAIADDDWLPKEKQLAMRAFDTDRFWQEVPYQKMLDNPSPFSFLNQAGSRYYLPAYMRLSVKFPLEADYASSMLLLHLYPWTTTQGEKPTTTVNLIAESLQLNKAQCAAVYRFFKFCEDEISSEREEWIHAVEEWKRLSQ